MKTKTVLAILIILSMILVTTGFFLTIGVFGRVTEEVPLKDDEGRQPFFIEDGNITEVREYSGGDYAPAENFTFNGTLYPATTTNYVMSFGAKACGIFTLIMLFIVIILLLIWVAVVDNGG